MTATLKQATKHLEQLKEHYDNLRANIADDFKDDWIDKALDKVEQLKELRRTIEQLENIEVNIHIFNDEVSGENNER
ncbi:hypothetical protein [Solibacillus isronensis]|uniref:hypothetical protein n=1 Tax=Solibacillus isronensis TaxID=412383 RepID=UPI0039A19A95